MSIYKIAEPLKKDSQNALAVGIDLGTTHSLAAIIAQDGTCHFLADDNGDILLPSAVSFTQNKITVGDRAAPGALISTKRLMGQSPNTVKDLPFAFHQATDSIPLLRTDVGPKTAIEAASEILKVLWARALRAYPNENLKGAVITVPAYFDDAARKATADAARLAQIPVLRLINEPTAAAYAYGYGQAKSSTLLVFDFGGGTFDVSCLSLEKGIFRVLSTVGDLQCGGDTVDALIVEDMIKSLALNGSDYDFLKGLREKAKVAKEQLTNQDTVSIHIEDRTYELTQNSLASMATPLIKDMIHLCEEALHLASLGKEDITDVLMVGGSTRLTVIQTQISSWFGKPVKNDCDPDTIVARGAAYQADRLAGNRRHDEDDLLVDVTPLSIGLEMMGGINEKVIARNTPIPARMTQRFTTYQEGQTGMKLHIVQGEREMASDCLSLGQCELKGIPALPAGKAEVEVVFILDADGMLTVNARETHSDAQVSIELKPSYGLDDETVLKMLESSLEHADEDIKIKQWRLKTLEAQQLLQTIQSTLTEDGARFLSQDQLLALEKAIQKVQLSINTGGKLSQLSAAIESLEPLASYYIDCRLQAGLNQVLSGQTIDKLLD